MKNTNTTQFGNFLRKLRIEYDESGHMMAAKLDITQSYLSAVELGKRSIPMDWRDILIDLYSLRDYEIEELDRAIICSSEAFVVDVSNLNSDEKLELNDVLNKINGYNTVKYKMTWR